MDTTAVTYRTGAAARELRTVVVRDARQSVVLLPSGRLEIFQAKLLHGTACSHRFWAEALGFDPDSDDFGVPMEQVVSTRTIDNIKTTRRKH